VQYQRCVNSYEIFHLFIQTKINQTFFLIPGIQQDFVEYWCF